MNAVPRFLLRIPSAIFTQMLAHAETERPLECCGLLSGVRGDGPIAQVSCFHPLRNQLASATEFLSEPADMFSAVKQMRRDRTEILSVYHSHPTSSPIPSKRDLERNFAESVLNLIIGWQPDGQHDVRAWWLMETGFESGQYEVVDFVR